MVRPRETFGRIFDLSGVSKIRILVE